MVAITHDDMTAERPKGRHVPKSDGIWVDVKGAGVTSGRHHEQFSHEAGADTVIEEWQRS